MSLRVMIMRLRVFVLNNPTSIITLVLFLIGVVIALPAVIIGSIGLIAGMMLLSRRIFVLGTVVLLLLGGGLIYLWYREILVILYALRDVVQSLLSGLLGQYTPYKPANIWPILLKLWGRTWPIAPMVTLVVVALWKPGEARWHKKVPKVETGTYNIRLVERPKRRRPQTLLPSATLPVPELTSRRPESSTIPVSDEFDF